jgi:hypothetical protein
MKKFITLVATAFIIGLTGCSSSAPTAAAASSEPVGQELNAYYVGEYKAIKDAKAALTAAGFEIVGDMKSFKKGKTILFTNDALKAEAAKPTRGFVGVMRLLVDDERKQISVTNPIYFGKSFMQKDFNYATFKAIEDSLLNAFPSLKAGVDHFAYDELSGYHFMMGMPYYDDVVVLAEGKQADLLKKATKSKKAKKTLVFEIKLSETSTLLGYKLGKRTSKFVKKTGTQNATVLPYCVLIENGEVKILNAKYYLAVSYPQLTMGEFMTIATVPGAIEKDLKKPFK